MPPKIRELQKMLLAAGCVGEKSKGKGSHSKWSHAKMNTKLTLSGRAGDDAKPYQVKLVQSYINAIQRNC